MDIQPFIDLVKEGGSVLIALAVLAAMIYFGYRLVWVPSQRQVQAIAEVHRDAATQNAKAAQYYTEAAKLNSAISEANARTAASLEKLAELIIKRH